MKKLEKKQKLKNLLQKKKQKNEIVTKSTIPLENNSIKVLDGRTRVSPSNTAEQELVVDKVVPEEVVENSKIAPKPTLKLSKLQQEHEARLESSKFRWLNETLYTKPSQESFQLFQNNPELYDIYHTGFSNQAGKWPLNPVDLIIKDLSRLKNVIVADMGCGNARLAQELRQFKVHSFDLHAGNEFITACDIANVPLPDQSCDIAVYCLSLMGTNFKQFLMEAFRILKKNGILKIAEVVSRMDANEFISAVQGLGFKLLKKRESSKMFILMDFVKDSNLKSGGPDPKLKPCIYKKR